MRLRASDLQRLGWWPPSETRLIPEATGLGGGWWRFKLIGDGIVGVELVSLRVMHIRAGTPERNLADELNSDTSMAMILA
jgi:hypothetical protein